MVNCAIFEITGVYIHHLGPTTLTPIENCVSWIIEPTLPGNQPRLRDLEWWARGVWMGEIVFQKKTVGFSRLFWLFTQEV